MSKPKIFEITAMITRTAVIVAHSEKEAMDHVSTWEQAWESNSDLVGVSDVELSVERELVVPLDEWQDEAHDISTSVWAKTKAAREQLCPGCMATELELVSPADGDLADQCDDCGVAIDKETGILTLHITRGKVSLCEQCYLDQGPNVR